MTEWKSFWASRNLLRSLSGVGRNKATRLDGIGVFLMDSKIWMKSCLMTQLKGYSKSHLLGLLSWKVPYGDSFHYKRERTQGIIIKPKVITSATSWKHLKTISTSLKQRIPSEWPFYASSPTKSNFDPEFLFKFDSINKKNVQEKLEMATMKELTSILSEKHLKLNSCRQRFKLRHWNWIWYENF